MSKSNLPDEFHAEVTNEGAWITLDCGDNRHYLTGPQITAIIDNLSGKYLEWRALTVKRGKMAAVLDRCVTGRPS